MGTKQPKSLSRRNGPKHMFGKFAHGMVVAAGATQFFMMLLMTAHVVGRKLGHPVPGALETSEQLMVVVLSFPLAAIGLRKAHIVFELVTTRLPARLQAFSHLAGEFVGATLFTLLAWKAWQIAWSNYLIGEYTKGVIDFPVWPFRFALAVGLSVFCIQLLVSLLLSLGVSRPPAGEVKTPKTGETAGPRRIERKAP